MIKRVKGQVSERASLLSLRSSFLQFFIPQEVFQLVNFVVLDGRKVSDAQGRWLQVSVAVA